MKIELGKTLRSSRKKAKMSTKVVVEQLKGFEIEISEKTLYSYETGYRMPDADTLMALCQIYGINDIMKTFGYKVEEPEPSQIIVSSADQLSHSALEVARAYDKANVKDKNTARSALDLPPENALTPKPKRIPRQSDMELSEELVKLDRQFIENSGVLKCKNSN